LAIHVLVLGYWFVLLGSGRNVLEDKDLAVGDAGELGGDDNRITRTFPVRIAIALRMNYECDAHFIRIAKVFGAGN